MVRDTRDGECIGTSTQRNRRSDSQTVRTTNDMSPGETIVQEVLPRAC